MNAPRLIGIALLAGFLLAGGYFFFRNLQSPDAGKAPNVAEAPAGGRTQADPGTPEGDGAGGAMAGGAGSLPPVSEISDPLVKGVSEAPDIPPSHAHQGIKLIGERIREAVLADGTVGDHEVPGVDLTGLSQGQRRWFLSEAVGITCPCGCRQDLLECRRDDDSCPTSPGIADSLVAVARRH
jgi:hypothetical protein